MRFGVSNVLMAILVVATAVAWRVDRRQMQNSFRQYEEATEATLQLFSKSHMMQEAIYSKHADTDRLHQITDWHDERADIIFRLLAIFNNRDQVDDTIYLNTVTSIYMEMLDCSSLDDLQQYLRNSEFDVSLVLDPGHPRYKTFSEFILAVTSDPYSWE